MHHTELSRRVLLRRALLGSAMLALPGCGLSAAAADDVERTPLTAAQALARLKQGNANFVADKPSAAVSDHMRRQETSRGQTPFAVLVGCSDSRVPPEQLFGTGLGELFIIRNAGNTVDTVAMGSIEYGTLVLGAPLVVVLGHERCGAVKAALEVVESNTVFPWMIGKMVEPIIPAALLARSKEQAEGEELLGLAVHENIMRTVTRLRTAEPSLVELQNMGKLKIVGATYDLDTGEVVFEE